MCNGGCCSVDYDYLQSIAYELRCKIAEIGDSYTMRLKEGYACSPSDFDYSIRKISRNGISKNGEILIEYKQIKNLLSAIEYQMKSMYRDYKSCICSETICKLKDNALNILNIDCYNTCRLDLKVDENDEKEWTDANPYCVSREKWEELLYRVCSDMEITLTVVKKRCDIVYSIHSEYQSCDIEFDLESHVKDCNIEYDILRSNKDCNITFDTFSTLRSCNITFKTIADALDCGISFDIDRENNCPVIVTLEGGYSLCNTEEDQNEQLRNIIRTFSVN